VGKWTDLKGGRGRKRGSFLWRTEGQKKQLTKQIQKKRMQKSQGKKRKNNIQETGKKMQKRNWGGGKKHEGLGEGGGGDRQANGVQGGGRTNPWDTKEKNQNIAMRGAHSMRKNKDSWYWDKRLGKATPEGPAGKRKRCIGRKEKQGPQYGQKVGSIKK